MNQSYANNIIISINFIFSKIKNFRNFFSLRNSGKKIIFALIIFVFCYCENASAQCSINTSTNSSSLNCGTSPFNSCGGVLYIGDGINAMTLTMDSNLDLSTCLGPIQLIVRNGATIDFNSGKNYLKLAAGSSIAFQGTGTLTGGSCNASERIYIGSNLVASCNGQGPGADNSFLELVGNGGYNIVSATVPFPICGSGSFTSTATTVPNQNAIFKWYTSGGALITTDVSATSNSSTYTNPSISSSTTYYVEAIYNGYTTPRKAVTVTVNPNLVAAVSISSSVSGATCTGTPVTFTATPTNGGGVPVYQWKLDGVNVGSNLATYTSSLLASGNTVVCVMTSNAAPCLAGNPVSSNSITMIVNPGLSIPIISTIIQPDCISSTGSVALSGLPSGSWSISPGGYAGNTTSTTITGLVVGTYNFKATNAAGCTSAAANDVVINSPFTNTWSGGSWSLGIPPTSLDDKVVFADNYSLDADVIGCSCLISGGKNVIIKEGRTLKIKNGLDVQSAATLTFENNASLVQINDQAINTGNIVYKRKTTPIDKFDYTYWSSPVKGQVLLAVSPNTLQDKFYSFNPAINDWQQENPSNVMQLGKGYIIRGPQEYTTQTATSTYEASFIGIPNNGIITTPVGIAASSNLIGNPYPSALDADSFLIYNKDFLNGTIYFWTHNTDIAVNNPNPGSGVYAYSSNDYASYNLTGGVATKIAAVSAVNSGAVNTNTPSGKIASGQSFFTTSIAAGNITFNNSMRVGVGGINGDNFQFFKFKGDQKTNGVLEKNRVWLNLSNNQGVFKQTLVGYVTGATDDYDSMFDGESVNGNDYVDFYSVYQDKKLVIQGRSLPFDQSDTIQLGYSANFAGSLVLDIDQLDGELKNQNIFIEDKEQHIIHNLALTPYEFVTESGTFNTRFVLRYIDNTNITDFETTLINQVVVSNKNKQLSITSFVAPIDKIIIFDTKARRVYQKTNVESQEIKMINVVSNQQILFVKVVLKDGKSVFKKIIY